MIASGRRFEGVDLMKELVVAAVIPGLLVMGWYQLAASSDCTWFAASLVLAAALGAALVVKSRAERARVGREPRRNR